MSSATSTTELRHMTADELRREILVRRVEYAKMRLGIEMQKEKNHARFKTMRREIARMSTVMKEMVEKNSKNPKKPKSPKNESSSSVSSVSSGSSVSSVSSVSSGSSVSSVSSAKASQTAQKPVKVPRSTSKKS